MALWKGSAVFEYAPYTSLWFAPAGFSVAILMLWRRDGFIKVWLCVWINSLYAQFSQYHNAEFFNNLLLSTALAFGFTLPYWLAVTLYNRLEQKYKDDSRHMLLKLAMSPVFLLAGALGAAILGISALVMFGDLSMADGRNIWLAWWVGDYVGVMILTPAFILLGARFFHRWTEPMDTLLVQNAEPGKAQKIDWVSWIVIILVTLLPAIIAIVRAEIDHRIPIILAFFLALLPITILAIRNSWAVVVSTILMSSLCIILVVKYFTVIGEGMEYQTTLLAIAITTFYFFNFVKAFVARTQQLVEMERSLGTASRLLTLNELGANIAHELRTPLQVALTSSQRVRRRLEKLDGDWSIETRELGNIKAAIDQAGKTIERVRNLVKSGAPSEKSCTIDDALDILRKLIEPAALQDGISLKIQDANHLPAVAMEKNELVQILLNLISNSLQSLKNHPHKEITITIKQLNQRSLALEISDSGNGVDPSFQPKIFAIGNSRSSDGLGLGLWVSQSIAKRRGGSLEYIAEDDARWYFRLILNTSER